MLSCLILSWKVMIFTHTQSTATADCYAYLITKTDIYFTLATAAFL